MRFQRTIFPQRPSFHSRIEDVIECKAPRLNTVPLLQLMIIHPELSFNAGPSPLKVAVNRLCELVNSKSRLLEPHTACTGILASYVLRQAAFVQLPFVVRVSGNCRDFVSVEDVLQTIHRNVHQGILPSERNYLRTYFPDLWSNAEAAYLARCASSTFQRYEESRGILRVDLLGNKKTFGGLSYDTSGQLWVHFLEE